MLKKILSFFIILLIAFPIFAETKDEIIVQLTNQLEKSTALIKEQNQKLLDNNKTIQSLQARITSDQKEIKQLRDLVNKSISNETKYYSLTGVITNNTNKNIGGTIIFGRKIPFLPLTVDGLLGVDDDLNFTMGIGLGIQF